MNLYLALFCPMADEAIAFHRAADAAYHSRVNGYGVKIVTWDRDKVEVLIQTSGHAAAEQAFAIARAAAADYRRRLPESDAEIAWGLEPQEPEPLVSPEDYAEWVAASCGEC